MLPGFALPATARAAEPGIADEIVVARDGGLTSSERARAGVTPDRDLPLADVEVVATEGDRGDALRALRDDPRRRLGGAEPAALDRRRAARRAPLGARQHGAVRLVAARHARRRHRRARGVVARPRRRRHGRRSSTPAIDPSHPDLAGRVAPGWDFVDGDADAAGPAAATARTSRARSPRGQNGAGVIGVAPAARDHAAARARRERPGLLRRRRRRVRLRRASAACASSTPRSASAFPSHAERRAIREHPGTLFVVASGNGGADGAGDDVDGGARRVPVRARRAQRRLRRRHRPARRARARSPTTARSSVDLFAPGTAIVSSFPAALAEPPRPLLRHGPRLRGDAGHLDGVAARGRRGRDRRRPPARPGTPRPSRRRCSAAPTASRPSPGRGATGGRLNAAGTAARAAGRPPGAPDRSAFEPAGARRPGRRARRAPTPAQVRAAAARPAPARAGPPADLPRRTGCRARTATLSFTLGAPATVTASACERGAAAAGACALGPHGPPHRAARPPARRAGSSARGCSACASSGRRAGGSP